MKLTEANSIKCERRMWHRDLTAWAAGLAVCLAALLPERPAAAQEFTFHAEPAAAFWVDEPQMTRFTPGFYFAARPGLTLGRVVALQLSYALLVTPAAEGFTEVGAAHFLAIGVRLRPLATLRPASEQLGGLFVDFNLGYVRTESLDRFGFDVGMGYGFQVTPWLSLGPVVRYVQIVQPNDIPNENPNDGQLITVGLDLAFGPAHREEMEVECPDCPECVQEECVQEAPVAAPECVPQTPTCPDFDQDGVCDDDDRCPTQVGPAATFGCTIDPCSGAPLVVLVQFEYDSAELPRPQDGIPQTMDPVLDAVAAAVTQNPTCRVCIIGYTSEEGPADYNQELSRRRATAVQNYLTVRGLTESRMPSTGLGARCQIIPATTRLLNRRVEFRRLQEGESCPVACPQ
jgi:hypothetical protein